MVVINDLHPSTSTSGQEPHSATSLVIAKGKRKAMCEPEEICLPRTPSRPEANSQIRLQSFSPDNIAIRYRPKLAQRMQRDTCFKCHKQGHWAFDCPLKSPTTGDFTNIYCRCGHGFCEVRTANNERNKGRRYYVCPIKRGQKCSTWIKWCDDPVSDSDLRPPPYKYPECGQCRAGVCRKEKEVNGPNAGRYYFACPVREGQRNCGFRLWEDDALNNANAVPVRQSCQKTLHYFWGPTDDNNVDSKNHVASVIPMQQSCRRTLHYSWEPTNDNNEVQRCKDLESRLENIHVNHVMTKASLEVSRKHSQSLREDVSRLKDMLYEMENQLISSEEETLKLEIDLIKINREMLEVERNLHAAEQAEVARKLSKERQIQQSVAKAALEMAKLEVGK